MRKFSDIIGQKAIIEHLYNALRTGSISHAYILSGDAGSGRKTIASIFAAALQCEDLQEEETEEPIPGKILYTENCLVTGRFLLSASFPVRRGR